MIRTPEQRHDANEDEAHLRGYDVEVDDLRGDEDAPVADDSRGVGLFKKKKKIALYYN